MPKTDGNHLRRVLPIPSGSPEGAAGHHRGSGGFAPGEVKFPSLAGGLNGTARAMPGGAAYVAASLIRTETARVTHAASATQFSSFSRKSIFIFISSS